MQNQIRGTGYIIIICSLKSTPILLQPHTGNFVDAYSTHSGIIVVVAAVTGLVGLVEESPATEENKRDYTIGYPIH